MVSAAPVAVRDAPTTREGCLKCKLYEGCRSPFMPASGSSRPLVLFTGEAPGENEDRRGEPFVGKAGKILRDAIETLELLPSEYAFTNAVRCRPPDNRTPTAREISHCLSLLAQDVATLDPKVVVLLGNAPLKAVLGQTGITNWNGVVVEREGRIFVPAYHPSFFNYGNADKIEDWLKALSKAVDLARGESATAKDKHIAYRFPKTLVELDEMFEALMAAPGNLSYDIESRWLREHRIGNQVLSVAFSDGQSAWSFPLYHPGTPSYYTDPVHPDDLLDILQTVLTTKPIIGHNIRFDLKQTRTLLRIEFIPVGDTMLMSQLVDSRKGIHGLKRLAGLKLGMFDYEAELDRYKAAHPEADYERGGDYSNVPLEVLLPYGGKDAAATWLLPEVLWEEMTELQRDFYRELLVPVDYALGRIETNGFLLDTQIVERYLKIYTHVRDRMYYPALMQDKAVQRYVKDRQAEDKKFEFNPNSSQQMGAVFFDYKKYRPVALTKTGKPSVSIKVLRGSPVQEDPIYEPYRTWSLLDDMIDKYLAPSALGKWDEGDHRVRVSFNLGGAKTGRMSSSSPTNLQNIPTPEKEPGTLLAQLPIKNIFTCTWFGMVAAAHGLMRWEDAFQIRDRLEVIKTGKTGCLCAIDYSSMELRVIASISQCKGMIEAFEQGLDPHCYVTRQIFPTVVPMDCPDKEVKKRFKEWRYKAKWTNWTLLYGGDEHTLHRMYTIPLKEAQAIVKAYYERFPEILDYRERTVAFAKQNGYVETPFGRRLYLPYINDRDRAKAADEMRTAINMPIQGTASDCLLCATSIVDHYMRLGDFKTLLVNTVHDSLVGDVYPGELFDYARLAVDVMENLTTYAPKFFPHMDFSWLTVPLKADVSVGTHYGALADMDIRWGSC